MPRAKVVNPLPAKKDWSLGGRLFFCDGKAFGLDKTGRTIRVEQQTEDAKKHQFSRSEESKNYSLNKGG